MCRQGVRNLRGDDDCVTDGRRLICYAAHRVQTLMGVLGLIVAMTPTPKAPAQTCAPLARATPAPVKLAHLGSVHDFKMHRYAGDGTCHICLTVRQAKQDVSS